MSQYHPMRELPKPANYANKDVMIVFGELFQRGYANGIVDIAKDKGMKVIYATVGRREKDGVLRALTQEELKEKDQPLINVPLEAGFDLEPSLRGTSPVEQLSGVKMSAWESAKLDWDQVSESQEKGIERFRQSLNIYLDQLKPQLPKDANLLFVHTMAGGFPRAKVVMPAANRVFKGYGERYCSSEMFWRSDIGKLCDLNFKEVTANTLDHLIELSTDIRNDYEQRGHHVSYVAYGYHGTECLVGDKYQWQSYSPYLQGWAKIALEDIARKHFEKGVKVSVFNAPEILTNSSSIFLGVEVCLYPLMGALKKEGFAHAETQRILTECSRLLKEGHNIEDMISFCTKYMNNETIKKSSSLEGWPQHNSNNQMKIMRESSAELIEMHKDPKDLITSRLSEVVFKACGRIMFNEAFEPQAPIWWLGHDIVAKQTLS